jgi:Fumarase C C-terminus
VCVADLDILRGFELDVSQSYHNGPPVWSRHVGDSILASNIGYDNAAHIAHDALEKDLSLRDGALQGGLITADDFDRRVILSKMG